MKIDIKKILPYVFVTFFLVTQIVYTKINIFSKADESINQNEYSGYEIPSEYLYSFDLGENIIGYVYIENELWKLKIIGQGDLSNDIYIDSDLLNVSVVQIDRRIKKIPDSWKNYEKIFSNVNTLEISQEIFDEQLYLDVFSNVKNIMLKGV
jgi:hypothetical protein